MSDLNSLLGAQWLIASLLFFLAGGRIASGLIDPLRNKPQRWRDLFGVFAVRYRLATALAVLTTALFFLDMARLRYKWHVLWMAPNATTWWELAWRSVWLAMVVWWVGEQCWPVIASTYREIRKTVTHGRIIP